jgi:uncharacterized protein YndB with AHSA1/START domain
MKNSGDLKVTTPTDREIVMTRTFDAPRQLVFEAMSRPEMVKRWLLGPPGWEMVVCENDLRVGGAYRHVWRHSDGNEMTMRGVYHEVVPPERVVRTESFEMKSGPPMGEQVATMVLTEQGGRTSITITVVLPSKEARDGMIAGGMERGVAASYDRLAELLAESRG